MVNNFDVLIEGYLENEIGIAQAFLGIDLARHLKDNLIGLHHQQQLFNAGTGWGDLTDTKEKHRTDTIHWLDRVHNNVFENHFFDVMDAFVLHLNTTCYTGIKSYEFHYTRYGVGSYYKAHRDQFRDKDARQFSVIIYLNTDWEQADGGELCVYGEKGKQLIAPLNDQCVFFKSNELLHEVLVTHSPRLSITGWLKC